MAAAPFLSSSWYRVAHLRPRLREHADVHRHRYRGRVWYVLNDQVKGQAHRLSRASYLFVGGMDGSRTLDELWTETTKRAGQEAPSQDEVVRFLAQLHAADLLQSDAAPDAVELIERAGRIERSYLRRTLLNPFALRIPLWDPERFLTRTLPLVGWLFGRAGALLWLVTVVAAVLLAAGHWDELSANASDRILAADNLLLIALSYPAIKALHELGHAYAVKRFGGAVHELGLMLLVFLPVPYVDASAASGFRSKSQRVIVGAAGMLVEMFIAALATFVWLLVEPGLTRAVAFDVMLVAGVSTVLFNGNPLLRYDGYFILVDLLEIPNLAQRAVRYWGYLIEWYVFRTEGIAEFAATRGERIWFLHYAPAAFLYRQFVMLAIALFVASQYLAVGVALAVWSLFMSLVLPVAKALWQVIGIPRRNRNRAIAITGGAIAAITAVLFLVPVPLHTTTEGVVWLPENANVRAATDGFARRLLVAPGTRVARRRVCGVQAAGSGRAFPARRPGARVCAAAGIAPRTRDGAAGRHRSCAQPPAGGQRQALGAAIRHAAGAHRARSADRPRRAAEQGAGRQRRRKHRQRPTRYAGHQDAGANLSARSRAAGRGRDAGRLRQSCLCSLRARLGAARLAALAAHPAAPALAPAVLR
jgi:putative peptide zinc metalloprotease protein